MNYPSLIRIRQHFDAPKVDDIPGTTKAEVQRVLPTTSIKSGDSVAVAVGSRGIANLSTVVKAVIEELQAAGAKPYIVPAMGSHGGGTAEGQADILDRYGVSEKTMGVPVRASMEVIEIGKTDFGMPIYFDKEASKADHVVVCNRVKPHTGFAGEIESGLYKMMLIGLGKHKGAAIYHRAIIHHSFDKIVKLVGATVIEKMPIAFGIAMLENGYDETARVQAVPVAEFEEGKHVLFATEQGLVKKTELSAFSRPKVTGIIAMKIMAYDQGPEQRRAHFVHYSMGLDIDVAVIGMDTVAQVEENVRIAESFRPLSAQQEQEVVDIGLEMAAAGNEALFWLPEQRRAS